MKISKNNFSQTLYRRNAFSYCAGEFAHMSISLQYGGVLNQSKHKFSQNNSRSKSNNPSKINFGRALTSDERKFLNLALERVNQINCVQERAVIIPSAAYSGYAMTGKDGKQIKVDTGVGSPYSKAAQERAGLLKDIYGINAVQDLPTGAIVPDNHKYSDPNVFYQTLQNLSPLEGSSFEKGTHLVDPVIMHEQELVSLEDIEKYNVSEIFDFKTENDYTNYFKKEETFFKKAYENFKKLDAGSELKKSYEAFLTRPVAVELEKKAVLTALTENLYGQSNFIKWNESLKKANSNSNLEMDAKFDRRLYFALNDSTHKDHEKAKTRLQSIKSDAACGESMDFYMFKQFIAHNQAKQRYDFFHANNIKVIADVPVRTNLSDVYGNPEAFDSVLDPNGGTSDFIKPTNVVDPPGVPALKNNDAAKKLVARKYEVALETADTAHIGDGLMSRFSEKTHDIYGGEASKWDDMGEGFINEIKSVFIKNGKELPSITSGDLNIGGNRESAERILAGSEFTQIRTGEYDCAPDKILTIGNYDKPAMTSRFHDREAQINEFANLSQGLHDNGAKGAKRTRTTFVDLLGMDNFIYNPELQRHIYIMHSSSDAQKATKRTATENNPNWKTRMPLALEERIFSNLAGDNESGSKLGLNAPKVGNRILYTKNIIGDGAQAGEIANHSSINDATIVARLLQHFEEILEQKGVYTTKEADADSSNLMKDFYEKFGKKAAAILNEGYDNLANKVLGDNRDDEFQKLMLKVEEAVIEHKNNFVKTPEIPTTQAVASTSEPVATSATEAAKNVIDSAANAVEDKISDSSKTSFKKFNYTKAGLFTVIGLAVAGGIAKLYLDKLAKPKHNEPKHNEPKLAKPKHNEPKHNEPKHTEPKRNEPKKNPLNLKA